MTQASLIAQVTVGVGRVRRCTEYQPWRARVQRDWTAPFDHYIVHCDRQIARKYLYRTIYIYLSLNILLPVLLFSPGPLSESPSSPSNSTAFEHGCAVATVTSARFVTQTPDKPQAQPGSNITKPCTNKQSLTCDRALQLVNRSLLVGHRDVLAST